MLQSDLDDLLLHLLGDLVPEPAGIGTFISKSIIAILAVAPIPVVERGPIDTQFFQGSPHREFGLFHRADVLRLISRTTDSDFLSAIFQTPLLGVQLSKSVS